MGDCPTGPEKVIVSWAVTSGQGGGIRGEESVVLVEAWGGALGLLGVGPEPGVSVLLLLAPEDIGGEVMPAGTSKVSSGQGPLMGPAPDAHHGAGH